MAVTVKRRELVRALLVAHAQMTWNRMRRGLGRRGLVGLALLLLFLMVGVLPLFFGFGSLGYLFGGAFEQAVAADLMGVVLTISTVGFGVIGGMLGGARQLTWEAYRAFPVSFRTLFVAETLASLTDLVAIAFVGVISAMGAAFSWQQPSLLPIMALLVVQVVLWVLFLQQLVGALAVSSIRRLRRAMLVLVVAAWCGVSVVAGAAREVKDQLQGAEVERLRQLWSLAQPFVHLLPPVNAVRGMALAQDGHFGRAALFELPMLIVTLLLGVASYLVLAREESPHGAERSLAVSTGEGFAHFTLREQSARDSRSAGPKKGPHAIRTIAELHLAHIVGSLQGRFGLIVPLITVVLVKGPLAAAGVGTALTLPGSVLYLALAGTQFHFNQFGFDGQGVKTLLLLPISMRELLLGKGLALFAYALMQNLLLLGLLGYIVRPGLTDVLAGAFLGGCLAVAHALEGHWISAMYPRPMAMHRMNAGGLAGANLLPLGAGLVNGAVFGGLYALVSVLTPEVRVPVLGGAFLLLVVAYAVLLPRASSFVTSRRETLVEVLG